MRGIMAWFVGGLPFEPRSRRAIDETLADWAHEQLEASTRGRRALAGVRGVLSVARVVLIVLVREAADLGWARGLARRCGLVAAAVALLALATAVLMLDALDARTLALVPLGMPLALLIVMPPAIFLVLAWRPVARAVPTAGSACFLALVALALAGWLVPHSSELVNDLLRQLLGATIEPEPDAYARLSLAESALAVSGWTCLSGATAICAASVARRSPLRSRWWLAGVPAIYAALTPLFTFAIGSSFIVFRSAGDPPEGFRPGLAGLTTAAVVMTLATTYGRLAVPTPDGPASTE